MPRGRAPGRRPPARPTRGKTAPGRLRKTDAFLALAHPARVAAMRGLYVDVGFGEMPVTTVETLHRLRRLNAGLRVLGIDIDPARVRTALPWAEPGLEFRVGGFDLPLHPGETVSVIRAVNVLRQYPEPEAPAALETLAQALEPGGLLLEGTSDPTGRLVAFNVLEQTRSGLARTALVLAPSLRADFAPRAFQAVLPKLFIHHAEPGGAVDRFFADWHGAWQAARRRTPDRRAVFVAAALVLAHRHGYQVDGRRALLRRGFLALGPGWPAPMGKPPPAG
jgi:SAM-dependent methyltransferase